MSRRRGVVLAGQAFCLALLAACGGEDKQAATQVAAKVNSHEITVHQVNSVLARAQNVSAETAPRAKREILDRLIEQELARQQAVERKLDRSPQVVQALEAAKTEILARAYLQQVAEAQAKPTPEEVKKYYVEHPELFAERRIYAIEEIVVQPAEGLGAQLRERVAKARSMQEIVEWLKARETKYSVNRVGRAPEQIPLLMLPELRQMKDGDMRVIELGGRLDVIRVVATKPAPVDEASATPRIQQFLFNRRSSEVIAEEVKRLKEKAKIEYAGEFAGAPPAAPAKVERKEEQSLESGIEKGLRGLK